MKANKTQLDKMAAEANPYKVGSPYGLDTRGYKLGFPDGYEKRDSEIKAGKISDEELRKKFEETYEPNMIYPDTEQFIRIAKEYARTI